MKYKILTGKYGNGTDEQNRNYKHFLGEIDTEELFNLYFQWYNVIHKIGHILIESKGLLLSHADEEQLVNDFAIAYWREVDGQNNMEKIKCIVDDVLLRVSSPVPKGEEYLQYFRENWEKFNITIETYVYFQILCVESALRSNKNLNSILKDFGYSKLNEINFTRKEYKMVPEVAIDVVEDCRRNIEALGISLPDIEVILVENPDIQYCKGEE